MSPTEENEQVLDDRQLMRSIAQGGNPELGLLYTRHKDKVLALAYRILGQWSLAEDVCQEVFIRVQRAAPKYRPDAEFTTWLYRIVVNLCLDEKRRQKRTAIENSQITELLKITKEHPCGVNQKIETIDAVKKAVKKLNKRQQTVVEMHKIEGLSHTEISKRTGWSQSSIESLLVRAYKKLRIELVVQKDK
jgi:RNA polymerase sigma-70 factor (ECF subfamily)